MKEFYSSVELSAMVSSRFGVLSRLKQKPTIVGEGDQRYDGEESRAFIELVKANRYREIIGIECAMISKLENIFDYLHMLYLADLREIKYKIAKLTGKQVKKLSIAHDIHGKRRSYAGSINKRATKLSIMLASVEILYSDTVQLPEVAKDAGFYEAVGEMVEHLQTLLEMRAELNGQNPNIIPPESVDMLTFLIEEKKKAGERLRQLHDVLIPGFEECRIIWSFKSEKATAIAMEAQRHYAEVKERTIIPSWG